MRPKRYVVWSKNEINLDDAWQKKWYLQQVLTNGRAEDIKQLDWEEVSLLLKELTLPEDIRRVWESYFAFKR